MNNSLLVPSLLYHYCSLETFKLIMNNSTIRMSNVSKSNDQKEITYMIPDVKDTLNKVLLKYNQKLPEEYQLPCDAVDKNFDYYFNQQSLTFYVTCFSEEYDKLSQWRGYADDGNGVAIGFNSDCFYHLCNNTSENFSLQKVVYSVDSYCENLYSSLTNKIDSVWSDLPHDNQSYLENVFTKIINVILYNSILYKNNSFQEEAEWRLIFYPFGKIRSLKEQAYYDRMSVFLNKINRGDFIQYPLGYNTQRNKMTSYIDLSFDNIKHDLIKEIVLGPKTICDNDFEMFLISNGYNISKHYQRNGIKIFKSISTYR